MKNYDIFERLGIEGRIFLSDETVEIDERINSEMEKVDRDFRYKNAQSEREANYTIINT